MSVYVGTIYMTVLVTLNRYVAVCRPYAASDTNTVKRQARLHVALVATFAVLFNITRFFEWTFVDSDWRQTWLYKNLWYKVRTRLYDQLPSITRQYTTCHIRTGPPKSTAVNSSNFN